MKLSPRTSWSTNPLSKVQEYHLGLSVIWTRAQGRGVRKVVEDLRDGNGRHVLPSTLGKGRTWRDLESTQRSGVTPTRLLRVDLVPNALSCLTYRLDTTMYKNFSYYKLDIYFLELSYLNFITIVITRRIKHPQVYFIETDVVRTNQCERR